MGRMESELMCKMEKNSFKKYSTWKFRVATKEEKKTMSNTTILAKEVEAVDTLRRKLEYI